MPGVLAAFVALFAVALLGYVVGALGVLRLEDERVLSRLAFFVATPALLFHTVATADLGSIFSPILITNVAGVAVGQLAYVLVARLLWKRDRRETTVGVIATTYVNAGILGIAVSVYALGDGALIVPVVLFQLLVLAPIIFLLLEPPSTDRSLRRALLLPVRNPLTVASLLGLLTAVTGLHVPDVLMRPVELVGAAAVPVILIAYGVSLSGPGTREMAREGGRDVVLAVFLKTVVVPAVAYLVARHALGLEGTMLLAATLFAALPTAQNVYVYALHFGAATNLARGAIFVSTLVSIPLMALLTALLG
ncbi:AEC family transporter [Spongiactinospora sp. TRM90649]|uniref:AEC family transporter n=1 Tax=Spongiactinospora sp. TRM90649 TaxID=3031114 RepID=UPI0023F9F029|nr:AEC family transporter [Spongiactinospora sp. TRM90649]MDF5752895.1 AEC family transporter [Spongiactinospora sp. TRM90649]